MVYLLIMYRRLLHSKLAQRWPLSLMEENTKQSMAFNQVFVRRNICRFCPAWNQPGLTIFNRSDSVCFRKQESIILHSKLSLCKYPPHLHQGRSTFHTSGCASAGHNKWSKVKYIKGPKDQQRSLIGMKIAQQMRVVIKEGGPNPDTNTDLAILIAMAKTKGIPKSTIENVIQNAVKSKGKGGSQFICEGQGPKGAALIVEYITDNQRRSREELIKIFKSHGCTVGAQGTVLYAFSKKGVIELTDTAGQESLTYDIAMEVAIETGAEDVIEEDEDDRTMFKLVCDQADFRNVRSALGNTTYGYGMASLEYIPESTVALNEQELERMGALITELEEHPSVLKVSHNIVEET